jgi:uncharacterized membrane protein YgaE (UPF0421/DUF939 family)
MHCGEGVMKRVSMVGVVLGALLGVVASLLSGSWLVWLGIGLAIGLLIGSTARGNRLASSSAQQRVNG